VLVSLKEGSHVVMINEMNRIHETPQQLIQGIKANTEENDPNIVIGILTIIVTGNDNGNTVRLTILMTRSESNGVLELPEQKNDIFNNVAYHNEPEDQVVSQQQTNILTISTSVIKDEDN